MTKTITPSFELVYLLIAVLIYVLLPKTVLNATAAVVITAVAAFITYWIKFNLRPRNMIDIGDDKAVLITGCDTGFGHSLALRLDGLGFKVYAGCLQVEGPNAQELKKKSSELLHLVQMDVTKQDQVDAGLELVVGTLNGRKLWAVVNNAGIAYGTEMEWCSIDHLKRVLDINAVGPARVTKTFLPLLRRARGRIVIVASSAGRVVLPGMTPYSMSKFAAIALSDGLRREMKKWGVTVHSIEPSFYKTNIISEQYFENHRRSWDELSDEIRSDYGFEYFRSREEILRETLKRSCRPAEKIYEVIDDLVDAVAGAEPLIRYVPNWVTKLRVDMWLSIPTSWLDRLTSFRTPRALPAGLKFAD